MNKEEIENRIYNGWAFTDNEEEKAKNNREIYKELLKKYKILKYYDYGSGNRRVPTQEEIDNNDIVYVRKACYNHGEYILYKAPKNITTEELLLIFDEGNLCFGGNKDSYNCFTVFED